MCDFCYIFCFGFQTNCLYSAHLGCYFPTFLFLALFVDVLWGAHGGMLSRRLGRAAVRPTLQWEILRPGLWLTVQVPQQRSVQPPEWCVFIFLMFSFCFVQVVAIWCSLFIHHHTQLWYYLSFITNSLSLPSLTSWAHVLSMAEVLFVQNLHISYPELLLPNVWGSK